MVNKTKSGIVAVGDPMSVERIKSEARIAIEQNMDLLKKTDEGQYLIRVFISKAGMTEDDRHFEDYLHEFLRGFLFAYDLSFIKVNKKKQIVYGSNDPEIVTAVLPP